MIVVGLTGSIGMGKSTAAAMFRSLGVPVHDADASVHRLLGRAGAAVAAVEAAFPGVAGANGVDRAELGRRVFGDTPALRRLEAILHPMVRADERRFLERMAARRKPLVVLDIPLLFESGSERRCDVTVVVSAPRFVQRARVLRRKTMTEAKFAAILAKQMNDQEKRRRADFVVPTGLGRRLTLQRLQAIVTLLRGHGGMDDAPRHRRGRHARDRARH
jgi:dephospho-CoA kinase